MVPPPQKRFRLVPKLLEQLTHTSDGVFAVDADERIIVWNQAATALLGYTPAEVLGKYCYDVIQAKDYDGNAVCQKHCPHIEQAKKFHWQSHENFQTRSKSGESVTVDVTTLSILFPQRELAALVHIFREADPATPSPDPPAGLEPSSLGQPVADRANVPPSPFPLSSREMAVLLLMAEGQSTKEIGAQLFISPVTVRNHIQNILRKLDVHTRLEAILWDIRRRPA